MYVFSFLHQLYIGPGLVPLLIQSADSPGFPCLTMETIWCCQGIFMKATEVNNLPFASRRFYSIFYFIFFAANLAKLSVLPIPWIRLPTKGLESSDPTSTPRGTLVIPPNPPTFDGKKKEYIIAFARSKFNARIFLHAWRSEIIIRFQRILIHGKPFQIGSRTWEKKNGSDEIFVIPLGSKKPVLLAKKRKILLLMSPIPNLSRTAREIFLSLFLIFF